MYTIKESAIKSLEYSFHTLKCNSTRTNIMAIFTAKDFVLIVYVTFTATPITHTATAYSSTDLLHEFLYVGPWQCQHPH